MISCDLEPKTPVVKPSEFDKTVYQTEIRQERNKIGTKKPGKKQTKEVPDSNQVAANNPNPIKIAADTIPLKIVYGKAKIDTLKSPGQSFVFLFDSDTAHKLSIKVSSVDTLANLRISRVMDSGNHSQGPFGRELEYNIQQKGLQKVVVSENQIGGKPWGGRFTFEVKLGW